MCTLKRTSAVIARVFFMGILLSLACADVSLKDRSDMQAGIRHFREMHKECAALPDGGEPICSMVRQHGGIAGP